MASVEPRYNKKGEITSYRITVSEGVDSNGEQIRHRKLWKPPKKNMTARQLENALELAKAEFILEIRAGYQLDHKQTFAQYAEYVIDLKERNGAKTRTIDGYRWLLVRTNKAIGHLKLADIKPQHLNAFYKNLSEEGVRQTLGVGTAKIDIRKWLKEHKFPREKFARTCGIAPDTLCSAANGERIREDTADKIARGMMMKTEDVFDIWRDTTKLSNKTILEYHRFISCVMAQAEKEMLIPFNPASRATPPRVDPHVPDYYQPETVTKILDALDTEPLKWRTATYLLIDTGCRRGEIMGLKWENVEIVDDNIAIITISRSLLYSRRKGVYDDSTKARRERILRIAPETIALLKEWKEIQDQYKTLYGDAWIDSGYVFTRDNGQEMNPDSLNSWLSEFSKKHDLPHIHPHAFRHTTASLMIANGIDIVTAAGELGHSTATTTANIYAHQIAEAKARAGNVRAGLLKR